MGSGDTRGESSLVAKPIEIILNKLPHAILAQQQFQKYITSPIYRYLSKLLLFREVAWPESTKDTQKGQVGIFSFQNNYADSATTFRILAHLDEQRYPYPTVPLKRIYLLYLKDSKLPFPSFNRDCC